MHSAKLPVCQARAVPCALDLMLKNRVHVPHWRHLGCHDPWQWWNPRDMNPGWNMGTTTEGSRSCFGGITSWPEISHGFCIWLQLLMVELNYDELWWIMYNCSWCWVFLLIFALDMVNLVLKVDQCRMSRSWVIWAQEPVDQSETAATIGSWHCTLVTCLRWRLWFCSGLATVGGKHVDSMDIEAGIVVALHTALTEKPWAAKTLVTGI